MALYFYAKKLQMNLYSDETDKKALPKIPKVTKSDGSTSSSSSSNLETKLMTVSSIHFNGLYYKDNKLVGGKLDSLISYILNNESSEFSFAFLLLSRIHLALPEVLGSFYSHTSAAMTCGIDDEETFSKLLNLVKNWTQWFPYDFRDERMMGFLRTLTQKSISFADHIGEEVSELLRNLLGRLSSLEKHEIKIQKTFSENYNKSPLLLSSIVTICGSSLILAQHLVHIEMDYLSFVGPQELLKMNERSSPLQILTSDERPKITKTLSVYLYWHTRLRFFIASEIVKVRNKKERVVVIEFWIETALECFRLSNFNSLMAILMAFNLTQIKRLRKTWRQVKKSDMNFLTKQMSPSNDYETYRKILQARSLSSHSCLGSNSLVGVFEKEEKILIPFISLILKDFHFYSLDSTYNSETTEVIFNNISKLSEEGRELLNYQKRSCSFPKVLSLINTLQLPPVFTLKELSLQSFECEPPFSSEEKKELKELRDEKT